jgi:hypothetical protein
LKKKTWDENAGFQKLSEHTSIPPPPPVISNSVEKSHPIVISSEVEKSHPIVISSVVEKSHPEIPPLATLGRDDKRGSVGMTEGAWSG